MVRLALLLVLWFPSSAFAATVTSHTSCNEHGYCDKSVTFRADPGGAHCVWGGAGNDRIAGGGVISGGPGSDVLTSIGGATFVDDDGATPAPDRYIGAAGAGDTVSYAGRKTSVDIDLRRAKNAGDTFTSIENATGGDGDDRLIGTDGPNTLSGGRGCKAPDPCPGHDRIFGLGGDDSLSGALVEGGDGDDGLSGDVLDGGPGDDSLDADEVADCGPGKDQVQTAELGHVYVRANCESAEVGTGPDIRLHRPPAHAFLTNTECYCRYAHYIARARGVLVAQTVPRHVALRLMRLDLRDRPTSQ